MFFLAEEELRRLRRRARYYQRNGQREVCGLLGLSRDDFITLFFLKNGSGEGGSFSLPMTLIRKTVKDIQMGGLTVVGSFHSHPISEAVPSKGDLLHAFYKGRELIYDVCGGECRLWKLRRQNDRPVVSPELLHIARRRKDVAYRAEIGPLGENAYLRI